MNELRKIVENHCRMGRINQYRRWPILCLITKQKIPQEELNFFATKLKNEARLRIAIFVSISFLSDEIEKGAAFPNKLLENFQNIEKIHGEIHERFPRRKRQLAGIHFWRPLISGSNDDRMDKKISSIKNSGAVSSVAIGLKLSKKLVSFLKSDENKWYEIQDMLTEYDIKKDGYELFDIQTRNAAVKAGEKAQHPIFLNTSCAVSHAFSVPDYNATFSNIGKISSEKMLITKEVLHGVGLSDDQFVIHNEDALAYIEIKNPIEQEKQTYLRQMLGLEVLVTGSIQSTHEWRGNTSKLTKGEYCINAHCPDYQRSICSNYYDQICETSVNG